MSKASILTAVFCSLIVVPALAAAEKANLTVDASQIKWSEVVPGVSIAPVQGDPNKGSSHFFLKYAAGLKTPSHHHTPDHFVTLLTGILVLTVDGADHKLTPGSFFALRKKAAHVATCEGSADCVMSVDARGTWDVVPEKK